MTQQFTASTDGQNVSIAAGDDPVIVERVRTTAWRDDAILKVDAATIRAMLKCDADSYMVGGVLYVWNTASTVTDTGGDAPPAFQITGITTGRYLPVSSLVNGLPVTSLAFPSESVSIAGNVATVQKMPSRGALLPELEDYFASRLDAQWRMDRNSISLAGSGVSSVVERVTTRAARAIGQATDSKRPSYHASIAALGGRPAIGDANVGAGHTKVLTCGDSSINVTNPYWRYVVFAPRVSMVGADVRLIGSADANRYCEIDINTSYYAYEGSGSTASVIATPDLTSTLGHLLVTNPQDNATEASNAWILRADGKMYRATGLGSVTGRGSGDISVLSWNVTSGLGAPVYIADVGQGTGTIKALDRLALIDYVRRWYGFTMPTREILFDGNSLMVGAATRLGTMADALTVNSAWANTAVSGRITPAVDEALPYASAKYSTLVPGIRRAYCVFEITNDISQYSDGSAGAVTTNTATVLANIVALIAEARAQGFTDIILGTCLPRGSFTVGNGQETIRQNINTHLTNNWQAMGITKLVNFHTATAIDGQTCPAGLLDPTNLTYWNADQTHLIDAGYALFVPQFQTRLVGLGY